MKLEPEIKGCQHKDIDLFSSPRDGVIGNCYDCGKPIKSEDEW